MINSSNFKSLHHQIDLSRWSVPSLKASTSKLGILTDTFLPRNPITGNRQIHFISSKAEKYYGDEAFQKDLSTKFRVTQSESRCSTCRNLQTIADEVFCKIIACMPKGYDENWPMRVSIVQSNLRNGRAYRGGHIVLDDSLMHEIITRCLSFRATTRCPKVLPISLQGVCPQDVIAIVIGHEMMHILGRHSSQSNTFLIFGYFLSAILLVAIVGIQATNPFIISVFCGFLIVEISFVLLSIGLTFSLLAFRRSQELESDRWGMVIAANAQFDPKGALVLAEIFRSHEKSNFSRFSPQKLWKKLNSTHPSATKRLNAFIEEITRRDPTLLVHADVQAMRAPQTLTCILG